MKFIKLDDCSIGILPELDDDIWNVYNLISVNDTVAARTDRKIKDFHQRITMMINVKVDKIEYDRDSSTVRLKGKILTGLLDGNYHTLEIEPNMPFILTKPSWDLIARDILRRSRDQAKRADLGILLMHDGLAHLFQIGGSVTKTVSTVKRSVSRKHGVSVGAYDSDMRSFFESVMDCVLRHINFKIVRRLVIASPGCINEIFCKYLLIEAERRELKSIMNNKSRIVLAHANTGFKHGLKDVLNDPNVVELIKDTQVAVEARTLKDFNDMLRKDDTRICYGSKEVDLANKKLAIKTLLITDELFRNSDANTRIKYVNLVESVRGAGGTVNIFSSLHETGRELANYTGIAAILRFPLPELNDYM